MSERHRVAPASDLQPGDRVITTVNGLEIGVVNVDGELYALSNTCPHYGGPVCDGKITPEIVADWPGSGERTDERLSDDPAIACPWHGWEFNMETGDHVGNERVTLPTFDVVVDDGVVFIEK